MTAPSIFKTNPKKELKTVDGLINESLTKKIFLFVKTILYIVFLPFIWFKREFSRFKKILANKSARSLTEDEIYFISSWPIFLALMGSLLGLILGLIGAITNSKAFWERVQQTGKPFEWIGTILNSIYVALAQILGYFFDLLVIINNILLDYIIYSKNISIPLTVDALLLLIVFLLMIVFIESKVYAFISKYVNIVVDKVYALLYKIFNNLPTKIWLFLIYKVGKRVMGNEKLEKYNILFFKKLILATFYFSFIVFFGGIVIFLGQRNLYQFKDAISSILFLIAVLLIAGIIAGFPVTYFYMKFLSNYSEYKYILRNKEEINIKDKLVKSS